MELKDVLYQRRSVRSFKEQTIKEEDINELLHAATTGPSACNRRPWEFYVITNQELLSSIQSVSSFSHIKAPLAIVVCGNLSKALPMQLADFWIQDCSAATQNILLRATDLGLGTVWCGIYPMKRPIKKLSTILNLPEKHIPLNIIYIGYPVKSPEARDQYEEKRVHYFK